MILKQFLQVAGSEVASDMGMESPFGRGQTERERGGSRDRHVPNSMHWSDFDERVRREQRRVAVVTLQGGVDGWNKSGRQSPGMKASCPDEFTRTFGSSPFLKGFSQLAASRRRVLNDRPDSNRGSDPLCRD